MDDLRSELKGSPAIHPGGRRTIAESAAMERLPANAVASGIALTENDLSLLLSGHITAVRMPFVARRGWPDPAKYGHPDPRRSGFSAMTPARHVEFRGVSQEHGPWSHFQPLDVWKNDVLWVKEDWCVGSTAGIVPVGMWPVMYAHDGSIDACGSDGRPEWGNVRNAEEMPIWASRITLQVESVAVTPLSMIGAVDLDRLGLNAQNNASTWDEANPSGPPSTDDPMVVVARVTVHLENALDHLARRPQKEVEAVPDLISMEDA